MTKKACTAVAVGLLKQQIYTIGGGRETKTPRKQHVT